MSSSIADFLRRFLCTVLLFSLSPAALAIAQESHCHPDYVPIVDWPSPLSCNFELHCTNERSVHCADEHCADEHCASDHCGWVNLDRQPEYKIMAPVIIGLGTHDTVMLPTMAAARIASTDSAEQDHPIEVAVVEAASENVSTEQSVSPEQSVSTVKNVSTEKTASIKTASMKVSAVNALPLEIASEEALSNSGESGDGCGSGFHVAEHCRCEGAAIRRALRDGGHRKRQPFDGQANRVG